MRAKKATTTRAGESEEAALLEPLMLLEALALLEALELPPLELPPLLLLEGEPAEDPSMGDWLD